MALYRADDERRISDEETDGGEYRSPFRRDYARLVHSSAFRRLQGKTQLFPVFESDFFRNRLTHSVEVAQVAKSIALRLNHMETALKGSGCPIDLDIIEFAGLAHDIGHPPFGHNGERALDNCMKASGGFEGNAQTLRIVTRIEKRRLKKDFPKKALFSGFADKIDYRCGINPTVRGAASLLKYDREIKEVREPGDSICKGYYRSEADVVSTIKNAILDGMSACSYSERKFKTIECWIMDLADDIAYSTYDLEDSFKAGFQTPLKLLSLSDELLEDVASKVTKETDQNCSAQDVRASLIEMLASDTSDPVLAYRESEELARNAYRRVRLTSRLVSQFVNGVRLDYNEQCPPLSKVSLEPSVRRRVEILKHINYKTIIGSPRLKVAEFRGYGIVKEIFDALAAPKGGKMLPDDVRVLYNHAQTDPERKRVICDFIAGMTDSYAVEFYSRLKSENANTIFRPF